MIKGYRHIFGDWLSPLPLRIRDTGYMPRVGE